jgi:hypothetical protein
MREKKQALYRMILHAPATKRFIFVLFFCLALLQILYVALRSKALYE